MIPDDPLKKVLHIDLSLRRFWVEERKDLFENRLGGAGVAIELLREECKRGCDPLSPDNPIIFSVGPLTACFPIASKTVAMFKSPLTKNLGESHAGGRSAVAIRSAGYGAIVIKGKSETPVYLVIQDDRVNFRDASVLWGMRSSHTVGRVIREREGGAGVRAIMRIGRAGEKLVAYSTVITETYRHFGRLGLGAVFGSKKLKALMIQGRRSIKVGDIKLYREVYKELYDTITKSAVMKKYHELGTPMNIIPLNELKALPTRNLSSAYFEDGKEISGEAFAERFLGRRVACAHCPVACIHLAALRVPYVDEPFFYKTIMISYDYELIYALGSMLGVSSPEGLLRLIEEAESLGLDAMSTGVVLAWTTEAQKKGLISQDDTEGLMLEWSDYKAYIEVIRRIVDQPTPFFKELAQGVARASSVYGGKEFALSFGGNEMPGYHTGPAAYIGYLTGARHSHLDGAGYSLDEKMAKEKSLKSPEEVAEALIREEGWRQVLSSLVICYFARGIYRPSVVVKALKVMGYELGEDELEKIGKGILRRKQEFKLGEGFDFSRLELPKRVFETPTPLGYVKEDFIKESVNFYVKKLFGS